MTKADPELETQRRRAFRALLRRPLLAATGETAEEYMLVRRHSDWLKQWLKKFPAWNLHIDREVARLRKVPADFLDDTRPAIDRSSGATFTRRRYALLCLALAALEQLDRQTTLLQIAETIMELVAADRDLQEAGLLFDVGNYDQRRDLLHAAQVLVDTGVLRGRGDGERQLLDGDESWDVPYDVNRQILALMLDVSHSPSAIDRTPQGSSGDSLAERAARLGDCPMPATEDERGQRIRSRLVRALLDDPILYLQDLNDEERNYLEKHRGYLLREITEATDLVAEVRAEGIAMVDDAGDMTDLDLPGEGVEGHLHLLLVEWFAECSRVGRAVIPVSAVEDHVRGLVRIHGSEWHQQASVASTAARLTGDALLRLRALRLILLTSAGVVPLAAAGRYATADGMNSAMVGPGSEE